jgi:CubicO group peptidase (beta-lactamase class C family)
MTLRDYGRFGEFMLGGGVAGGKRVVPAGWVAEATRVEIADGYPGGYGYFWWVDLPDAYEAEGIFGQSISIFPKARVVVVQNAAWPVAWGEDEDAARRAFVEAARKAAE